MAKLITMKGPNQLDQSTMNNFEAALHALAILVQRNPDLTWTQLFNMTPSGYRMGDLSDWLGRQYNNVADVVGNVVGYAGDAGGKIVRLIADPKVSNSLQKAVAGYESGGLTTGLDSLTGGGGDSSAVGDFMNQLGDAWKKFAGGGGSNSPANTNQASITPGQINMKTALIVVGGVTGLFLLMRIASKKK